ncbi:hypothetical protein FSPOR_11792 [Fusarium sporotrichioides]|uniref:Uncharacterized protein n=1 Tax=Fusarium sporotrichioides TaxID=5514 RepID=A0A395RG57_FUSSP|nr:hypothetical protein FSPOR_11792 [Fusarium sporotrichioides]
MRFQTVAIALSSLVARIMAQRHLRLDGYSDNRCSDLIDSSIFDPTVKCYALKGFTTQITIVDASMGTPDQQTVYTRGTTAKRIVLQQ